MLEIRSVRIAVTTVTLVAATLAIAPARAVPASDPPRLTLKAPHSAVVGAPFAVTVTAVNAHGKPGRRFRGRIRLTSTHHALKLPKNYHFRASDHGRHTFATMSRRTGRIVVKAKTTAGAVIASARLLHDDGAPDEQRHASRDRAFHTLNPRPTPSLSQYGNHDPRWLPLPVDGQEPDRI
jgi:hypothetical protein